MKLVPGKLYEIENRNYSGRRFNCTAPMVSIGKSQYANIGLDYKIVEDMVDRFGPFNPLLFLEQRIWYQTLDETDCSPPDPLRYYKFLYYKYVIWLGFVDINKIGLVPWSVT